MISQPTISDELKILPGKSAVDGYLPLWMHLMDTAGIMELLMEHWVSPSIINTITTTIPDVDLVKTAKFLGATHDIGKATPTFINRIFNALPDDVKEQLIDYDIGSTTILNGSLTPHALASEYILLNAGCNEGISSIIGAHHGVPRAAGMDKEYYANNPTHFYQSKNLKYDYRKTQNEIIQLALKISGHESIEKLPKINPSLQFLISGLLIVADWIASNSYYFPLIANVESSTMLYPQRIQQAWDKLQLPPFWESACFAMDVENFQTRFGFLPNAMQSQVVDIVQSCAGPGLFILEAQMGTGKTEAALAMAEILGSTMGYGGVFMGLPTQATANGIFPSLKTWGMSQSQETQNSIRLAHGMAELNDDYSEIFNVKKNDLPEFDETNGLVAHDWLAGKKQALLSNFVIGTIDQLLMVALKQRHAMLRHIGIAGKVVIIDECHAYDVYMSQYLLRTLAWLGEYGASVIVLSATLPAGRRAELVEAYLRKDLRNIESGNFKDDWKTNRNYPLFTWTDGNSVFQEELTSTAKETTVLLQPLTENELLQTLSKSMENGGCAGVIVNTVKRAQTMAQLLRAELDCEVILMHASYVATHRGDIEKKILQRVGKYSTPDERNKLIVVGTQVLEQSLDIDFDVLITDLCPIDLLIQRIGRLHRHQRTRPIALQAPICYIINMSEKLDAGSVAVYGEWILRRTYMVLPKKLKLPNDISPLINRVYDENDDLDMHEDMMTEMNIKHTETTKTMERMAQNHRLTAPPKKKKSSPKTISGWLDAQLTEEYAERSVRYGDVAIEVIVLRKREQYTVSSILNPEEMWALTSLPSDGECKQIAREVLRLPSVFSKAWIVNQVVEQLDAETKLYFKEWQQSRWLRGKLFLLLNEDNKAQLAKYSLTYDNDLGLIFEEQGDKNATRV